MPDDLAATLRGLPLRVALLTDAEGAIVLRAGTEGGDDANLDLQRMGATFAQTAEQASKAGLGKNLHTTAFYGTRLERMRAASAAGGRPVRPFFARHSPRATRPLSAIHELTITCTCGRRQCGRGAHLVRAARADAAC